MKVLDAKGITMRFPGVIALDNVDITFERGKIHCIIGENGAGKSTLIKCLTGVQDPDEGTIEIAGDNALHHRIAFRKIAYVPQEIDLFPHMTVAENLFMPDGLGVQPWLPIVNDQALFRRAVPFLEKLKITAHPSDLVARISISEQQLLQIAHATVNDECQIVMLDEPTTSLTPEDTGRLFEVLRQLRDEGKSVVFISHKLEEIFAIGDDITVLRNGVRVAQANIDAVDIPWVIEKMTGRLIDQTSSFIPSLPDSEVLLSVRKLSGDKFHDVSFELHRGEILGFSGLVGAGRSEIMQALFGAVAAWGQQIDLDGEPVHFANPSEAVAAGIIYLPEERKQQGILPMLSVRENISVLLLEQITRHGVILGQKERDLVDQIIEQYQIKTASRETAIRLLSGGNQQKIIIGRAMTCNPKVLIFDEPTKGIDVGTKVEIYRLMKKIAEERRIGIILISSEMDELLRCCNRIVAVYEGEITDQFENVGLNKSDLMNAVIGANG